MDTKRYYDDIYYTKEGRITKMQGFCVKSVLRERQFILKWALKKMPLSILDLGCGKGHFTDFMESRGYDVTGVDISRVVISQAKKLYPKCKFLIHNLEYSPLQKKYDMIYSTQVIEHIFDLDRFLTNIRNSLDSNGILILATPNVLAPKIRLKMLFGNDSTFRDLAHLRFFSPSHLSEILRKNGFRIRELSGSGKISFLSVNLCGNILVAAEKM